MSDQRPPDDLEHRVHFADDCLSGIDNYVAGEKSGSCQYWHRSGQQKAEGQVTGDWVWCARTASCCSAAPFVDGEQHGFWRRWHDTGAVMDEGHWVHGKRSGEWARLREGRHAASDRPAPDRS